MVFFEVVRAVLSLDLGWLLEFVELNIFGLFIAAAAGYYFTGGKKAFLFFWLICFIIWANLDWAMMTGWVILGAGFLGLHYVTRVFAAVMAEEYPALRERMPLVLNTQFWIVFIGFNVWLILTATG